MDDDIFEIETANSLQGSKGNLKSERGPTGKYKDLDGEEKISLTAQQEMYCSYRAEGHNKSRAYKLAFKDCVSGHAQSASKLEGQEKIATRIAQLREERAWAAKLVNPQESLIRWNELYWHSKHIGDIKTMIECQKQIDKINGAEASVVRQQLEVKGLFRGEEDEWKDNARKLMEMIQSGKVTPIRKSTPSSE